MSDKHAVCRGRLRMSRFDALEASVKVPKIASTEISPENYAVFIGDDFYDEYNSCCAFEARANAIYDYIDALKPKPLCK